MKSTPLLLTLALLILSLGGYYLYDSVFRKDPLRPWDLVPSETVFVYEKDICHSCIEKMQESILWQIVEKATFHSRPVDSLKTKLGTLLSNSKNLLVSAHITRKDDFDFVYYLSDTDNLLNPASLLSALKGYRYTERELNSVKLHELALGKHTFSWVVIGNVWVGSFTPSTTRLPPWTGCPRRASTRSTTC